MQLHTPLEYLLWIFSYMLNEHCQVLLHVMCMRNILASSHIPDNLLVDVFLNLFFMLILHSFLYHSWCGHCPVDLAWMYSCTYVLIQNLFCIFTIFYKICRFFTISVRHRISNWIFISCQILLMKLRAYLYIIL